MTTPQIIMPEKGIHNSKDSGARLLQGNSYKDLSTICVIPTRGMVHARVLQSWFSLMPPMNQKFIRMFMTNMEVGEAYSQAINFILNHKDLNKWKYILTLEEDNMPPPDGLLRLYENIDNFAAVGGLYWTKGPGGQPMIYGDVNEHPRNFRPQIPKVETIQPAWGLGMGFTLFKLSMFKNEKLPRPFFRTVQEPGRQYTQDLFFYETAGALGYKFACDTRVKVGHYDMENDIVW